MMLFAALLALVAGIGPVWLIRQAKSPQDQRIIAVFYYVLAVTAAIALVSEALGLHWKPEIQAFFFVFLGVFWIRQVFRAPFWGKVVYETLLVAHLILGGYLYTASQIPYGEKPFAQISRNQPSRLVPSEFPELTISGIPASNSVRRTSATTAESVLPHSMAASPPRTISTHALQWSDLAPFMAVDSEIRHVLQPLREKQERDLTEVLAQLNATSVTGTTMPRHAIGAENIDDLLQEHAISDARYHTLVETWALLDRDEKAFRTRQADELFHALLGLLLDEKVDESHKVEFINFMVRRFPDDVRLVKPLIEIYDRLDSEYPRQKRLNQDFLRLYLDKRNAVLQAFQTLGTLALQPLLDYRKKTISEITYSQARLDRFLQARFGKAIRPLYGVAEGQSIRNFLNRQKYPELGKLSGASFEQEYTRRSLNKLFRDNHPSFSDGPVMGFSEQQYRNLGQLFSQGYPDEIDRMIIDPNPVVRANFAWQLACLKDPYTIPLVFELMRDANPDVRRLAAIAVGNFSILDTQGSNDPKFIEIIRMLQNYRSNSDAFGRAWAIMALATLGDKQKALYVIDLILNDGSTANSILGEAAPTWRSEEEKEAVKSLVDNLVQTPEELSVKNHALMALIALDSPETLGILLHYLEHIYEKHHTRPSLWRYIVPHMTLPQEAENVDDIVHYLAGNIKEREEEFNARQLNALHVFLRRFYEERQSGQFFQLLSYLKAFDPAEYDDYATQTEEQIRIMRIVEYFAATVWPWLIFWPCSFILILAINYGLLPLFRVNTGSSRGLGSASNRRSNPASDTRHTAVAPPAAIVPIKIVSAKQD